MSWLSYPPKGVRWCASPAPSQQTGLIRSWQKVQSCTPTFADTVHSHADVQADAQADIQADNKTCLVGCSLPSVEYVISWWVMNKAHNRSDGKPRYM